MTTKADRTPDRTGPGNETDMSGDDEVALSAIEAARHAGVNERTIRRAITSGKLRAVKAGNVYGIALADLVAWQATLNAPRPARKADTPADTGPDRTPGSPADSPPVSSADHALADELRRLLEEERAERRQAQADAARFREQVGYWQGQAEAFRVQVAALSARVDEQEQANVITVDSRQDAPQTRQNGPQPEQPARVDDSIHNEQSEHRPSVFASLWDRLRGRG